MTFTFEMCFTNVFSLESIVHQPIIVLYAEVFFFFFFFQTIFKFRMFIKYDVW